jgi:hypothetical protein
MQKRTRTTASRRARVPQSWAALAALILSFPLLGADSSEPDLELRANPRDSVALPGTYRTVTLTAEIVGRETEEYYCPEVVWVWTNGTRSAEESDCAPFESRSHYPRTFVRRVAAAAKQGAYVTCVELRKADEIVDRTCVRYFVH